MEPKSDHSTAVKRDGDPAPSAFAEAAGRLAPGAGGGVLSGKEIEMRKIPEFDNFEDAFAYCREADKPVTVIVRGEKWKLFPSGSAMREY